VSTDVTPPSSETAVAVALGRIEEQLHELGRKFDSMALILTGYGERLQRVEQDVAVLKAEQNRPASQWPAIAGAVTSIGALAIAFFAILYR
jgi:hypothetical protein